MSTILNRILIIVFAIIFLISGGLILRYFLASRQVEQQYDRLAQQFHQAEKKEKSRTSEDEILPQYKELLAQNSDLVGWISIEGTGIDYPVVQAKDNEKYLHHAFDRSESAHGCIFADSSCSVTKPSDNIILYGHHMKDGSMFAILDQYKKESFWQEHPVIRFDSLYRQGQYEVMAVFTESVNTGGSGEFRYYDFTDATNEKEFQDFVHGCIERSIYTTGVWAEPGDELLTLSTCEYTKSNGRMVVVARRILEGETELDNR